MMACLSWSFSWSFMRVSFESRRREAA